MKKLNIFLSIIIITISFSSRSQETKDITLKIFYNDLNLCNWEVTLKHGDVPLGKGITDSEGIVVFKDAKIISKSVDAFGYKKHNGGEKKWDAKGYINLNDEGYGELDFGPIVKDAGMPKAMLESSWGLKINDCGEVKKQAPETTEKVNDVENTQTTETEIKAPEKESSNEKNEYEIKEEGFNNQINHLEKKITEKNDELNNLDADDEENELSISLVKAEIKELEAKKSWKIIQKENTLLYEENKTPSDDSKTKENDLKDAYQEARDERKLIEKEKKSEENKGLSGFKLKMKIQKVKTEISLKERSIKKESENDEPDQDRLTELNEELKELQMELEELESNK